MTSGLGLALWLESWLSVSVSNRSETCYEVDWQKDKKTERQKRRIRVRVYNHKHKHCAYERASARVRL